MHSPTPKPWVQKLGAWSRSRSALTRFAVVTLAVAFVAGFAVDAMRDKAPRDAGGSAKPLSVTAYEAYRDAIERGAWGEALGHAPGFWLEQLMNAGPWMIGLALWSGLTWWLFLFRASEPIRPLRRNTGRGWLFGGAVLLGMLSTQVTLFMLLVFEARWGFTYEPKVDSWTRGVLFSIGSIGFREELAKLLCFLPLLPILLRRNHALEALIVASCVGLGFAVEENIGYFSKSAGASAVGRFLTANFLHMLLTGIVGHAVYWACKRPREQAPRALGIFVLAVIVHGVYDALLIIPRFEEYNLLAMTVFVLISYQYFHELRGQWTGQSYAITLTGTFVFGLVTTAAVAYLVFCGHLGVKAATKGMIESMIGSAVLVIMYFREVNESLGP